MTCLIIFVGIVSSTMGQTASLSMVDVVTKGLSKDELLALARLWTPRIGDYAGSGHPDNRWYCRLTWNPHYEIWLLGWHGSKATDFHDHGGSSGAVVVAAGEILEHRVSSSGSIRTVPLRAGETTSFGPSAIHDVQNSNKGPSISVHAYSPPLTTQTYYDLTKGYVRQRETVTVDGPEL